MVFTVILLFTVSTLAAHIHAVPTRELQNVVQHACDGEILCDIKPEDYSEEEMERFVAKNLHHLHRMKRHIDYEPIEVRPNNCVANSELKKFYTLKKDSGLPERVIQSGLFEQTVSVVECLNQDDPCFEDITDSMKNEKYVCERVYTFVYLLVLVNGTVEIGPSEIPTDCMCSKLEY